MLCLIEHLLTIIMLSIIYTVIGNLHYLYYQLCFSQFEKVAYILINVLHLRKNLLCYF